MMKREESTWSIFQFILLAFAFLILRGGVNIIVTSLKPMNYFTIIGFIMVGLSALLFLWWYLLHRSAKRSMKESLDMIESKYLEKLQKQAKRGSKIAIVSTAITVMISIYFGIVYIPTTEEMVDNVISIVILPIFTGFFGFTLFYWIFCHTPYTKFSRYYKERFVLEVLQKNKQFSDLSYQVKLGYDMDEVSGMNLFCMGERNLYKSEDTLRGNYNGRAFTFGDVRTGRVNEVGKIKYKEKLFYGQVVVFHRLFDRKKSDGLLLVRDRSLDGPSSGSVERVQTENVAFHDKFNVYAEKPLNSFYILTPPFMEKIMEVFNRLEGQLSLCFYKNTIYAAVNSNQNVFDPNVDIDLNEKKDDILNKDVRLIMEIVDVLIMSNKTKEE